MFPTSQNVDKMSILIYAKRSAILYWFAKLTALLKYLDFTKIFMQENFLIILAYDTFTRKIKLMWLLPMQCNVWSSLK